MNHAGPSEDGGLHGVEPPEGEPSRETEQLGLLLGRDTERTGSEYATSARVAGSAGLSSRYSLALRVVGPQAEHAGDRLGAGVGPGLETRGAEGEPDRVRRLRAPEHGRRSRRAR